MTLKLTLRPGESVFIGRTQLTVEADSTCTVFVDGDAPIMRANDMLDSADATEAVSRFRYVLQEMYLSDDFAALIGDYVDAVSRLLLERPEMREAIQEANQQVRIGRLYDAVRLAKRMDTKANARVSRP